jgi:L-amino acid N-acyltransferase YncA
LNWLQARFREGMRIKILKLPDRGFIEYIPGEYAWRAVDASGYMFIHCIWVVGKSKGKGFAQKLLEICLRDAEESGYNGVTILTSSGNWLVDKKLFVTNGFEEVDTAKPSFHLLVKKFGSGPDPRFTGDWDKKCKKYGKGLTVIRTEQCPYIEDATNTVTQFATSHQIPSRVIALNSAKEIRGKSPSPFGVFNIVYNGKLLSYHYLLEKDLKKRLNISA